MDSKRAAEILLSESERSKWAPAIEAMLLGKEALELLEWLLENGGEFVLRQAYRTGQIETVSILWNDQFLAESDTIIGALRAAKKASEA